MKIWIDADALPNELKELILRASQRLAIPTVIVANKNIRFEPSPLVSMVRVKQGADVADTYIFDSSSPGDFCVTADVPLAAALVGKGLVVIDPRGEQYSTANVGDRLAMRDLMTDLREAGVETGGPKPFSPKSKQKLAALLDSLLTKALRSQP